MGEECQVKWTTPPKAEGWASGTGGGDGKKACQVLAAVPSGLVSGAKSARSNALEHAAASAKAKAEKGMYKEGATFRYTGPMCDGRHDRSCVMCR